MRLVENGRDLIILTGCNTVGKTTASNYLKEWATLHKIPLESKIVADSQILFQVMQSDDDIGGFHHIHDWCTNSGKGHTHTQYEPKFPFTVTDNELPDSMRLCFFTKLAELPRTGNLWFAEWAAGVNTNPLDDPTAIIDYSYAKVKRMLQEGSIPISWLERVHAIINLTADYDTRLLLNGRRTIPSCAEPEALEKGTAFWLKDEKILRFYGIDDFFEIQDLFQDVGIPIYTIDNDGGSCFFEYLEAAANALFLPSTATVDEVLIQA